MDEEKKEEGQEILIFPLSKGKRFVAFLADFFLTFILSFALFHLAFYPLSFSAAGLYEEQEVCKQAQKDRDAVLYGNNLLFFEDGKSNKEPSSYSTNLVYTCSIYISSLLGESPLDKNVFHTYFVNIREDGAAYRSFITNNDNKAQFFDYPSLSLKSEFVEEFLPIYEEGNDPSKKGEEDYQRFQKEFFLPAYGKMIQDIGEKDLVYEGISYKGTQEVVASFNSKSARFVILSAGLSYLVSLSVVYLIVPLFSKTRKTLGMIFLRRERVEIRRLVLLRKRDVVLHFFYSLFTNAILLFLLPWPIVSFNELFRIPALWSLSLLSLLFDLVSLVFLLCSAMDRTLLDKLTGSVMLDEGMMASIYRSKGYGK